jgi:hypothetical protein
MSARFAVVAAALLVGSLGGRTASAEVKVHVPDPVFLQVTGLG